MKRKEKGLLYDAIGKFIFQYSQLEFQLRWNLSIEANVESELFDIVVGPYDFSMLCTVLERTLLKKKEVKEHKEIQKFFSRCRHVNNVRIRIVHGSWALAGVKHLNRHTLEKVEYSLTPSEIHKATLEVMALKDKAFETVLQ